MRFSERDRKRFWAKVNKHGPSVNQALGPCWLWRKGCFDSGYGAFWLNGQNHPAHLVAYELEVGPMPDGLEPDHLCRVRRCVRPSHIEPVTCQVNILRGEGLAAINAKKTACKRGHPFTPENTRIVGGRRCCRTCRRATTAAYQARQKGLEATVDDFTGEYVDRSRCKRGHEFTPENTRIRLRNGREHRVCIQCARANGLAYYYAHRKEES